MRRSLVDNEHASIFLPHARPGGGEWSVEALYGRLVELSGRGCATLSAVASLVWRAQAQKIPVAWLRFPEQTFYPPDFVAWGIDVQAMPVVVAQDLPLLSRAVQHLLHSGSFGLLVMDFVARSPLHLPMAVQGRWLKIAQRQDVALLGLTRSAREDPSLGSMVSLRGEVQGRWVLRELGPYFSYFYEIDFFKDKKNGPGWRYGESIEGLLLDEALSY